MHRSWLHIWLRRRLSHSGSGSRSRRYRLAGVRHVGAESMVRDGVRCEDATDPASPPPGRTAQEKPWLTIRHTTFRCRFRRAMVRHESAHGRPRAVHASDLLIDLHSAEAALANM